MWALYVEQVRDRCNFVRDEVLPHFARFLSKPTMAGSFSEIVRLDGTREGLSDADFEGFVSLEHHGFSPITCRIWCLAALARSLAVGDHLKT